MKSVLIRQPRAWWLRGTGLTILPILLVEFMDEVYFGAGEAAWPLIRDELALSYAQIGLLLGVPPLTSIVLDLLFGVLADGGYRRRLILGGGIAFSLSILLVALSQNFLMLLVGFCAFFPSSGAFVNVSQVVLMDLDPARHEQNMARWTFAGALGVFVGPLLLGLTGGDWRGLYISFAVMSLGALWWIMRFPIRENHNAPERIDLLAGLRAALRDLRRFEVLRWLTLLELANLMLDVLFSYTALYLVDVAGADIATAGIAVTILTGVGLVGEFLMIPLLDRVRGLTYLRLTALIEAALFAAFLLTPGILPKIMLLALVGLFNSGWYPVLQGQVYSAMPGRSGSVMTVGTFFSVLGAGLPFAVGAAAQAFGLGTAMWLLILGPVALLIGLPRRSSHFSDSPIDPDAA